MAKHSQKEVVYATISAFMLESGKRFDNGDKIELSPEDRKTIVTMIVAAIDAGEMKFSPEALAKHNSPEKVRNYSTGLLSNWLRKDKKLNGGNQHSIKNPGSRIGQNDDLIKSLKRLRKTLTNQKEIEAINSELDLRVKQLKQQKTPIINKADIPAHLIKFVKN